MAPILSSEVESDDDVDCFLKISPDIAAAEVELKKVCTSDKEIRDAITSVAECFKYKLKTQQEESIFYFVKGNDVFVSLPTGFGKSLCYILLPAVFDALWKQCKKYIILVVSPLIALMNDQLDVINAMGITAAKLSSSNSLELNSNIKKGQFQVLFISPENLVALEWRNMLASSVYRSNLIGFVVDEAHCIQKW